MALEAKRGTRYTAQAQATAVCPHLHLTRCKRTEPLLRASGFARNRGPHRPPLPPACPSRPGTSEGPLRAPVLAGLDALEAPSQAGERAALTSLHFRGRAGRSPAGPLVRCCGRAVLTAEADSAQLSGFTFGSVPPPPQHRQAPSPTHSPTGFVLTGKSPGAHLPPPRPFSRMAATAAESGSTLSVEGESRSGREPAQPGTE